MEYERILKVQTGVLSPNKLRLKLMGTNPLRKKDGSNISSSRTSPSKHEDLKLVESSLLAAKGEDIDENGLISLEVLSSVNSCSKGGQSQSSCHSQDSVCKDGSGKKKQQLWKTDSGNLSSIHPMRTTEDETLDYDSNASSSSFEFPNGERARPMQLSRSFSRPASSKWNDAEKWIMSRPVPANQACKKNSVLQNHLSRFPMTSMVRVSPESSGEDKTGLVRVLETKRVDFYQPPGQVVLDKFSFAPDEVEPNASQSEDNTGPPVIRAVSMRDMGTEMTPIASQDPSRTSTPVGATTPFCSPPASIPSTPGREPPLRVAFVATDKSPPRETSKTLSEQELKLKTRREIIALGVQLGKKNIAAWASKEDKEQLQQHDGSHVRAIGVSEFERRAAAWEQAEKAKHEARFKREKAMIQVWENRQKAKLEAEMRRIEAKLEQMRWQCQSNMLQKFAAARQTSEEKRLKVEARKHRQAKRTAAMTNYIRRKGRIPYSYICCGWMCGTTVNL